MIKHPRYPIYIPSKGRYKTPMTARFLTREQTSFYLVVEEPERHLYAAVADHDRILVLPESNRGVVYARNWIKAHATQAGYERHWQLDDNIQYIKRRWQGRNIPCNSRLALACAEDFVDRYENIAVAGLIYETFCPPTITRNNRPPFVLNCHIYSCSLILNTLPNTWRGKYNEDTDYCLQVLADGWCTVLFNVFMIGKIQTMKLKGGNTTDLYQDDGRLKMARALERLWPGVVKTGRRFRRPQHMVKNSWKSFDTPLKRKPNLIIDSKTASYGMRLKQVKPLRNDDLRRLFEKATQNNPPP